MESKRVCIRFQWRCFVSRTSSRLNRGHFDEKFKQSFGNNLIFYNSFRSEINDAFEIYPRKLHRYRLGLEILIECLILSKCDGIISNMTNVSSASIFLSKKRNKIFNIFLGYNSANKFIASFLWFLKKSLPQSFFGFNPKIF